MFQKAVLLVSLVITVAAPISAQVQIEGEKPSPAYLRMFRFTPDGKTLVGYTFEGSLLTWDVDTGKLLGSQPAKTESPTLDRQGKLLSMVSDEKGLHLMDVVSKQDVRVLEGADFSSLSKFDFSGNSLAFTEGTWNSTVKVWDITAAKEKASIDRANPDDFVKTLMFSPDEATLAILSQAITLWSVADAKQLRSIEINAGLARMAFTPDGKKICVSGFDNIKPSFIKCFTTSAGREVLTVTADASSPFTFSADGSVLVLARRDQGIFMANAVTGKEMARLTTSADLSSLTQISFSPNGKLLAIASTKGVTVVDVGARKELFTLVP